MLHQYANLIKGLSFRQWVESAGVVGLFVFAFGILFKKSVAHAGILLMTLSFGLSLKELGKEVFRDRLLLLSIAFFAFLMFRTIFAALEFPGHKAMLVDGALKLFGAGFFLVYLVAFWLHRANDKWGEILIIFSAGFLVQVLRQMDWGNLIGRIHPIFAGAVRATFGFSTNRFGLFSAVVILACLLLYRQIWGHSDKAFWHKARIVLWIFLCALSIAGLAFSQSRSAWFASALVMPMAIGFKLKQAKKLKLKPVLLIGLLFLIIAAAINLPKLIDRRLGSGIDSVSISARLSLYSIAWDNWKTHLLFGIGPGTSWLMIQQAGEEHAAVKSYDHLHNVVLDIGAQVGLVGIAFFVLNFYLIVRQAFCAGLANEAERGYVLFALSGIALILLTGIPNQPLSSPHGVYLIGFLGGFCYSNKFAPTDSIQTAPAQVSNDDKLVQSHQ